MSPEKEDENILQIIISDSGIGIAKENLSRIFDRFYQIDDTHTRKREGAGVGLAYTKELAELMGGNISVKSELDRGTAFTVNLPIHKTAKVEADFSLMIKEATKLNTPSDLISATNEKGYQYSEVSQAVSDTFAVDHHSRDLFRNAGQRCY